MHGLILCVLCVEIPKNSIDISLCELCVNRTWFLFRFPRPCQELPLAFQFRYFDGPQGLLHQSKVETPCHCEPHEPRVVIAPPASYTNLKR